MIGCNLCAAVPPWVGPLAVLVVIAVGVLVILVIYGRMTGTQVKAATREELVSLAGQLGLDYTDRDERNMSEIAAQLKLVPDEDYTSAGCVVGGLKDGVRIAIFAHVCEPPDAHVRRWHRETLERMGGIGALMHGRAGSTGPSLQGCTINIVCTVALAFAEGELPRAVLRPRPLRPWPISLLTSEAERRADAADRQYRRVYEAEGPAAEAAAGLLTHEIKRLLSDYPMWPLEFSGNVLAVCTGVMWSIEDCRRAADFLPALVRALGSPAE